MPKLVMFVLGIGTGGLMHMFAGSGQGWPAMHIGCIKMHIGYIKMHIGCIKGSPAGGNARAPRSPRPRPH